ncbi:MAG TPA: HEPN domain-containing protein [Bacillota bacterium]|nr:HEPN domain-containing protein [Bacillota bacterium]
MSEEIKNLIKYRLSRSQEALEEARLLARAYHWNTCVNRLYYACFYVISALFAKHNLSTSKHSGVRSFFNANFVKTGIIPKTISQVYNDLFERRQEGDYEDFHDFEEKDVIQWAADAESFVAFITELLDK